MKHLKIASISCGNSTTIVSTEVIYEWIGDGSDDNERYRRLTGGEVYITGSRNVFGEQYDIFTKLLITPPNNSDDAPVCIKQVAAGFLHSVLVSSDGELYCWGHNKTGDTTMLLLYNHSSTSLSTPLILLSSSSSPLLLSSSSPLL
jgi:alpha-tubulin suppressor-like RCC1 family protein